MHILSMFSQPDPQHPISRWSILSGKILHWLTIDVNQRYWHSTLPIGVLFCGDQVVLHYEVLPMFEEHHAQLLGISVDGRWSHRAFADDRNLNFPLLSDFESEGESLRNMVSMILKPGCERAMCVIDTQGIIQWSYIFPPGINPVADGILSALE